MATLEMIKNQQEVIKKENIVDMTALGFEVYKYKLTTSMVDVQQEVEKQEKKKLIKQLQNEVFKKGQALNIKNEQAIINAFVEKFDLETFNEKQEETLKVARSAFLHSIDGVPTKEEVQAAMEKELGEFWEFSYSMFTKSVYEEYIELIRSFNTPS
jgi:hypothetical protein